MKGLHATGNWGKLPHRKCCVIDMGAICLQEKGYVTADVADAEGLHQLKLSGTKFRKMLRAGEDIPEW